MCPECAAFNYAKREQTADLRGRVALVTGARVKIGYQAAIMLLRAGADVIVATRFPRDAARRFGREADSAEWMHRLHVYGIDLRHTPSVEVLAQHLLKTQTRLDCIINNACQTVRRPSGWYDHVVVAESEPSRTAFERVVLERNHSLSGGDEPAWSEPARSRRPDCGSQPFSLRFLCWPRISSAATISIRGPARSGSPASRPSRLQYVADDAR